MYLNFFPYQNRKCFVPDTRERQALMERAMKAFKDVFTVGQIWESRPELLSIFEMRYNDDVVLWFTCVRVFVSFCTDM